MNLSTNVLIDCNKFEFELVSKTRFKTNGYAKEQTMIPRTKDLFVYEYNIKLKQDNNKIEEDIEENQNEDIDEGENDD